MVVTQKKVCCYCVWFGGFLCMMAAAAPVRVLAGPKVHRTGAQNFFMISKSSDDLGTPTEVDNIINKWGMHGGGATRACAWQGGCPSVPIAEDFERSTQL